MKKNVEILDFEDKKTNGGKRYTRFKTSLGWMSCFDSASIEALKEFEGKSASVELIESGEFQNIKKCYGKASEEDSGASEEKVEVVRPGEYRPDRPAVDKSVTMYVSYAKDVFMKMWEITELAKTSVPYPEIMKSAIDVIKQAKTAFE